MNKIDSIRLLVTSNCPYNCFYCHREGMKSFVPELLNVSDYKYFVELLKKNFKLKEVTLTGGDPFCRKDVWKIVKTIKELGLFSIIITKGMLLNKLGLVDQITFTIDTLDENLYGRITGVDPKFLRKTISKLIETKSKNIRVVINTPISRNINDDKENFKEFLHFCQKYKVDEWKIIEEINTNKKSPQEDFYLEEYAKRMGLIKQLEKFKNYKVCLNYHGVLVTLYRCHCNAVKLLKKYIPESLFLDPAGNIILCMINDKKINLIDLIKNRDDNSIIKIIKNINFEKICPMLK